MQPIKQKLSLKGMNKEMKSGGFISINYVLILQVIWFDLDSLKKKFGKPFCKAIKSLQKVIKRKNNGLKSRKILDFKPLFL